MTAYNVQWDNVPIIITKGDSIDLIFSVELNSVAYDMTGMQLDIKVIRPNGTTFRSWTSAAGSPKITISTSTYRIEDSPITEEGRFRYDVQLTNGTNIKTIQKGVIKVTEEIT
jgi:hypothetical protein